MIQPIYGLLILATIHGVTAMGGAIPVKDENYIRFSMGSCNKLYGPEPSVIFDGIREYGPDVFVWTGDVVYADYMLLPAIWRTPSNPQVIANKFSKAKEDPSYQEFLKTGTPVLGVWDDHDFGINNGGGNFEGKELMRQQWLDFLDEPLSSLRRSRSGMYESYYIGRKRRVKLILLDNRYNRQEGDSLGEEQWEWLEYELINSPQAQVFLIAAGIQFLTDDRYIFESFYEEDRNRLFDIIQRQNVSGVILLSGDVHFGEILKYPCSRPRIGYPLYELTSSGLTHSLETLYFVGATVGQVILPETFTAHAAPMRYPKNNFGTVEIDFSRDDPAIKLQVRAEDGSLALEKYILLSEITRPANHNVTFEPEKCEPLIDPPYIRFAKNLLKKVILDLNLIHAIIAALYILPALFVAYIFTKNFINWLLFFLEIRKS